LANGATGLHRVVADVANLAGGMHNRAVKRVYSPHFAWVSRFYGATLPFE
jgi:hypothetical protein